MKQLSLFMAASLLTLSASAHNGATGIVKERMDDMTVMDKSMKKLAPLVAIEKDINYVEISALSLTIAQKNAGLLVLFPEGSLSSASEAKARIWRKWEDFSALMQQSEIAAAELASAASASATQGELSSQFKALKKTCKSCHRKYKSK